MVINQTLKDPSTISQVPEVTIHVNMGFTMVAITDIAVEKGVTIANTIAMDAVVAIYE